MEVERVFSRSLGHVLLIRPNLRNGQKVPLTPAEAARFKGRSASEGVNGWLKFQFIKRNAEQDSPRRSNANTGQLLQN